METIGRRKQGKRVLPQVSEKNRKGAAAAARLKCFSCTVLLPDPIPLSVDDDKHIGLITILGSCSLI